MQTFNKTAHTKALNNSTINSLNKTIIQHTNAIKALPKRSGCMWHYHNNTINAAYSAIITLTN